MGQVSLRAVLLGGAAAFVLTSAEPASAQTQTSAPADLSSTNQVTEVVVTARKRAESIQDVPQSITAFTGAQLAAAGVTQLQDYAVQVPNLSFAYAGFLAAEGQRITLRGIYGPNTTGLYIDDTPLPESVDPRVLDLDRIEALRGPQGTLYGARSEGGTVRLITSQPDATRFYGSVHLQGSGSERGGPNGIVDGVVNVPLVPDRAALRFNVYDDYESGFLRRAPSSDSPAPFPVHEGIGAQHHSGASLALTVKALDGALTLTPRVLVGHTVEANHLYADVSEDNLVQNRLFDINEPGSDQINLYSFTAKYDTRFGQIVSSTSEFKRRSSDSEDNSELGVLFFGTPVYPFSFTARSREQSFSEETRFVSRFKGPLQITAGVFYQNSKTYVTLPNTPLGPPGALYIDNVYDEHDLNAVREVAVFGETTYDLTTRLRLIAGGRYFDNTVDFAADEGGLAVGSTISTAARQHESGFNPKFGVQYKLAATQLIYASAAKGFRIGGVNLLPQTFCAGDLAALNLSAGAPYTSDSVWSYEVGAKTSWLGRRLTVDAAAFDIEWSNVQQQSTLPVCGFGYTVNSGDARSRGGEVEIKAALPWGFNLSVGAGYTDARITSEGALHLVPVGTPVQQVPKWTFTSALNYRFRVGSTPAFARAEVDHVDSSLSANNSIAQPRSRNPYTLVKLRGGVDIGDLELAAFIDNATDERANLSDIRPLAAEIPGRPRIAVNRPRTVGLDLRYKF